MSRDRKKDPRIRPPSPLPTGRFAPGEVIAGRYRIVAALGKGGMGEAYRADDLTLSQAVVLKLLPPHIATDPERLARLRRVVAAARKVNHPNVCRLFDLVEMAGLGPVSDYLLTAEFIDGEDLRVVLARVGRIPEEQAVEVARQLCLALAAIHGQGLLHRNLKPSNVLLDGRSQVRLADFELIAATGARPDPPTYLSPEEIAGAETTVRSDLFALGLVLYELFTGKPAFPEGNRATPPEPPSSHVADLHPSVERMIVKCLASDPAARPPSAIEVLAGLPGDPLAAALLAGQTPSPKAVAESGEVGRLRPWVGAILVLCVAAGLGLTTVLNDRVALFRRVPPAKPPAQQEQTARRLLDAVGAQAKPADDASGYIFQPEVLARVSARDSSPTRWAYLSHGRTYSLSYFYRQ